MNPEALAVAWPLLAPESRERVGALLRAAHELLSVLGAPLVDPGTGRSEPRTVGAETSASDAVAALREYEARAARFQGPTAEALAGIGAQPALATWASLARQAEQNGGAGVRSAVLALEPVYQELSRDDRLNRLTDNGVRAWLADRLERLSRAPRPEPSGPSAGTVIGLLVLLALIYRGSE